MNTAPPDQRAFIDRLTRADLAPGELHEQLLAATHVQDARRDWITANWPHVVELERINTLVDGVAFGWVGDAASTDAVRSCARVRLSRSLAL